MQRRWKLSSAQRADMWNRWKAGQSLNAIGRALGKDKQVIYFLLARHGGIAPRARRRSKLALTLAFVVLCCIAFTIVGLVVLALAPTLRLTILNLFLFIVGALPGAVGFLFVYGRIFARRELTDVAFIGIFPVLLAGGVVGGLLSVGLRTRISARRSIIKS